MPIRVKLEIFEQPRSLWETEVADVTASALEDAKLAAYETGYSAGWDDAVAAQSGDQSRLQAEIAGNLQALSFTYHEARGHVLRTLEPLLRDMTAKVLPETARQTLGQIVLEMLRPMASRLACAPISVVLHPDTRARVEPLLLAEANSPFVIVEDPSLGEGQVYLRLGDSEQRVDLDGVISAIGDAVDSFFQIEQQEKAYG